MNQVENINFNDSKILALNHIKSLFNVIETSTIDDIQYSDKWDIELELLMDSSVVTIIINVFIPFEFPLSLPLIMVSPDYRDNFDNIPNYGDFGEICIFAPI